jgi:aspartyl-tRNA(Asn)/glutamyl-tRNA(Gln) amidotransferase subunit C
MSKLTREQVLKLAALSKLQLTEAEIIQYQKELSVVLEYVDRLSSVNVDGLEPTYQVSSLYNVMREDEAKPQIATPDQLLEQTPSTDGRHIKVGRMI